MPIRPEFPPLDVIQAISDLCLALETPYHPNIKLAIEAFFWQSVVKNLPREYVKPRAEMQQAYLYYQANPDAHPRHLSVSLHELLPMAQIIDTATSTFLSTYYDFGSLGLLANFRKQFKYNWYQAFGLSPNQPYSKALPSAGDLKLSAYELVETFFHHTPFYDFFNTQVPFEIPRKIWASHGIILAPPNHGKTQLLGSLITSFLASSDSPGLFVLDPHGDLYSNLRTRCDPSRLVCLDPDTNPPALNFLDFGTSTEAQIEATFDYLMSSLAGGLSDVQHGCVPYLLKLLKQIPERNLQTLRQILAERVKGWEKSAFIDYIRRIPKDDQIYFEHEFYHHTLDPTKHSIARKISHAMASDTFKQMFGAKTNSVNFDKWIDERKVVVVKGGFDSLGEEGMRVFLQFLVGQYYAAGMRRISRVPESQRHLSIMFIDEASYVLTSPIIARILFELRKAGCALVTATQVWEQIGTEVKAAVLGGTAIKVTGPIQANDANVLSREMYTTPDFIRSMASTERVGAEWAIHVSPAKKAMRVRCPYGTLERMPKRLSDEQLMNMFVQAKVDEAKQKPIMPQTTPEQDEEIVQAMIKALDDDMKTRETPQSEAPTEKPESAPPSSEIKPGKKVW